MTYPPNCYDVVITYEGNIPDYVGRLVACDDAQAERLAVYDATSKGWPRECTTIKVKRLMN